MPVSGGAGISRDAADALHFALCLSVAERADLEISVALGNIVLADHGLTVADESLGAVPEPTLTLAPAMEGSCCDRPDPVVTPPRFRPALQKGPLSHGFDLADLLAVPIAADEAWWPASSFLGIDPRAATPRITRLTGTLGAVIDPW